MDWKLNQDTLRDALIEQTKLRPINAKDFAAATTSLHQLISVSVQRPVRETFIARASES